MNDFKTLYSDHSRFFCDPGDPIVPTYSLVYDDDGTPGLKETGKTNLYESIQSYRDSTDIHVLLDRYRNGEVDVLSRVQGIYADFTEAPKTFADMLNLVNAGKEYFDSLPVAVKQQYNNNFAEFMSDFGSESFYKKIGLETDSVKSTPVEEIKEVAE